MTIKRFLTLAVTFYSVLLTVYGQQSPLAFTNSEMASVGILVKDVKTDKVITSYNDNKIFTPASTMKLVTVAAAMKAIPSESSYLTRIDYRGQLNRTDSIFNGVIIIEPSGDPTINSKDLCDMDFPKFVVSNLKQFGVKKFRGDIIVNGAEVPQQGQLPTWEIEDACYGYGAGWYAFNYNDNTVRFDPSTGETTPAAPFLDFVMLYGSSPLEITHGVNSNEYTFSGKIPMDGRRTFTLPVAYPESLFLEQIGETLGNNDIEYEEVVYENPDSLSVYSSVGYSSPVRSKIYKQLMKHSDNTMAEATLRSIVPGASRDSVLVAERKILEDMGVSPDGMRIFDGSGLTRKNGVSPKFLTDVLSAMAKTEMAKEYASFFPVAGVDGTMRSFRFRSGKGYKLALKTGSVNGVRCYAGYLLDKKGNPELTIVLMVNHLSCPVSEVKSAAEKYFAKILKNY